MARIVYMGGTPFQFLWKEKDPLPPQIPSGCLLSVFSFLPHSSDPFMATLKVYYAYCLLSVSFD